MRLVAASNARPLLTYLHQRGSKGKTSTALSATSGALSRLLNSDWRLGAGRHRVFAAYDGRAVGEPNPGLGGERRLPTAVIYLVSVLVIAIAVAVVSALGIGTRTTYGSGISPSVGAQAQRDFLADQDAEAAALSKGEQSLLSSALTENALVDVNQQIADEIAAGAPPAITFQADSMNILQALDPADPSLTIEVQEDGTKTVTTQANQNSAPSTQNLAFHGTFWLRKSSSGRYQIADQQI